MAFGIDAGISRTTSNAVQYAAKEDEVGSIEEITSYGGMETKTEESFSSSFSNTALNGQSSEDGGSGVISQHDLIESNKEYARESIVTVTPLAPPAS